MKNNIISPKMKEKVSKIFNFQNMTYVSMLTLAALFAFDKDDKVGAGKATEAFINTLSIETDASEIPSPHEAEKAADLEFIRQEVEKFNLEEKIRLEKAKIVSNDK